MTAELGTETKRDAQMESGREVIEVTPEEVDDAGEASTDSPNEAAGAVWGSGAGQTADDAAPADPAKKVFCVRCGGDMRFDDRFCRNCGWDANYAHGAAPPPPAARPPRAPLPPNTSDRNRLTTLLLCVLLGPFGAHRFYLGKAGTGVLWLVTFGILGLGVVFDLVMIATGECRDIEGKPVLRWD